MNRSTENLTKIDISEAIRKVEGIHNHSLESINHYIDMNEDVVIAGFSRMTQMQSIDQKFAQMEEMFSSHPDFTSYAPYLVEVAALVS
ncbi:hypothetical protein [Vibrio sp. SCSIO 43137]|uniref:hypothetical protein n=1 Tax=Vibrio sp. SCSIO 43137 TaxID=3021011 RepID=UPI00230820E2|nr:hypothetical protein [Vibrio sp. SCSIO 43137]WCE30798.1 hypothetical protein PK654_05870 [Vibrio sp. SCSIO 43137]